MRAAWLAGTAVISAVIGGLVVLAASGSNDAGPAAIPARSAIDTDRPVALVDEISKLMPELFARGRKFGRLVKLEAEGVTPAGALQPPSGKLEAIFIRPRVAAEAGGAPTTGHDCLTVLFEHGAWAEVPTHAELCQLFADPDDALFEPRCTMRSVWELAKQRAKAPDGVAKIDYRGDGSWFFYIHGDPPFGAQLPDACR